jgi:hypothetical protein
MSNVSRHGHPPQPLCHLIAVPWFDPWRLFRNPRQQLPVVHGSQRRRRRFERLGTTVVAGERATNHRGAQPRYKSLHGALSIPAAHQPIAANVLRECRSYCAAAAAFQSQVVAVGRPSLWLRHASARILPVREPVPCSFAVAWRRLCLASKMTANPSIERTSNGRLRLPLAAAHVER